MTPDRISDAGYNVRSGQITNGSKHRLDFLRRINDTASHARIGYTIWSRRSDDALSEEALYYLLRFLAFHIETRHAGGKIFIARRVQLDTGHARKSLFHFTIELVCSRGDSRRADVLVKTNRLR